MTDEALIQSFEAAEMPPGGFPHREHVRVAWWYLCHYSWLTALDRFRTGLRRFAEAQGATQKYHETITTAYVLLINERLDASVRELTWDDFAARHADLLDWEPSILDRYYTRQTLMSARARSTFVMPDRIAVQDPANVSHVAGTIDASAAAQPLKPDAAESQDDPSSAHAKHLYPAPRR